MLAAVFDGGYGQPKLKSLVPAGKLETMAENFLDRLQTSVYIERLSYATFNNAARALLNDLSDLAMELKPGATCFIETIPHNLLQTQFLHDLAPIDIRRAWCRERLCHNV